MKKIISKLIIALVAMLGILYVVFQVYYVVSPNYRTEVAVLYEVSDEIYASGTVVRNEQVAETDPGVKYYIVQDGDKVAAGSVVAERYSDPAIGSDKYSERKSRNCKPDFFEQKHLQKSV